MYEEPHKGMDMMMLGMIGDSTQTRDQFITKQVSRHLFSERPPHDLGEDLMSLNMQRGRDHGIPGRHWLARCCFQLDAEFPSNATHATHATNATFLSFRFAVASLEMIYNVSCVKKYAVALACVACVRYVGWKVDTRL